MNALRPAAAAGSRRTRFAVRMRPAFGLVWAVALVACGSARQSAVDEWLLCQECSDGERDSVVSLGPGAVEPLGNALRGPADEREENVRSQAAAAHSQLVSQGITAQTESQYVSHFVANYVATYQSRAAIALGEIGTPPAIDALRLALDSAEVRDYRPDVVLEITRALDQAEGGAGWAELGVGVSFTCGVFHTGRGYCWGGYATGQIGNGRLQGSEPGQNTPVRMLGSVSFAQVAGGILHGCGTTPARRVFCWGAHLNGRLGTGSATPDTIPLPVQVVGPRMTAVTVGAAHACGLTALGEAFCWGSDASGQLGNGLTPSIDDVEPAPVAVADDVSFALVSAGARGEHTCGVALDGSAWCWGSNAEGQLGIGSTGGVEFAPAPVAGGHLFEAISSGASHSCGITQTGDVLCWGSNSRGQLGDPSGSSSDTPAPVTGLPPGPYRAISAGTEHSCAIGPGGAALCWGVNDAGQLGSGVTGPPLGPVPVSGGHTWETIRASTHTCGIIATRRALCWGRGSSGEIGNGASVMTNEPDLVLEPPT